MAIALVTGATKGLGRETARRLAAEGNTVFVGARDSSRGKEAAEELNCESVQLDVDDNDSVAAAAEQIRQRFGRIDILVNNAGIAGPLKRINEVSADDLQGAFNTNTFGVVRMMHAFIPLLESSENPVVVNVSSGLGSMTLCSAPTTFEFTVPGLAYHASKSALNMLTVQYSKAYPSFKINAVDPGFTATDINGNQGSQTVEQGVEVIVRMALIGPDGPTGGFFHARGSLPW